MDTKETVYDVIVIGAGASGSALIYSLAKYSSIQNIALIEKYSSSGQVNSKASNNSQTLHVGDIETNYSLDKVRTVYPASMMVYEYTQTLQKEIRDTFLFKTNKMVLGVGEKEVEQIEKRYDDLHSLFPDLVLLNKEGIQSVEPKVIEKRIPSIPLRALYTTEGYAVNFERLSEQLLSHAKEIRPDIDTFFSRTVTHLEKKDGVYVATLHTGEILKTKVLIANADSYSLLLAQMLGYGEEFSLIPIAGSFYFSKHILNGKVYTVQNPKLPFAAVHGDPDITKEHGETRWGPTARFHPVLEARNMKTSIDFIRSSGLQRLATWKSFIAILFDRTRFTYLLENMLYELPIIGKMMFIKNVQKIVPSMTSKDVTYAKGYGGMRLQRVDTRTKELLLGEGKIIGDNALFNMTPSPGASVCLYNALRDGEYIAKFLGDKTLFNGELMKKELYKALIVTDTLSDVSQKETYVS